MAPNYLLVLFTTLGHALAGFVHSGLMHSQADFNRMAQKVAAKQSPWIDSFNALVSNGHASLGYNPAPQAWAERGSGCHDNSVYVMNDAAAAYQTALIYKITGNTSYANQAIRILNGWAYTLKGIGCNASTSWDYQLMAGIQGYQFANAGEMMRNYSGWNATDFANFQNWMVQVWYPICYYPFAQQVYANWDLMCIAQHQAIGVLTDNQTMFNDAVNYFQTGVGNGAISQTVYHVHPGYYGQGQEAGRDQGHNTLDISMLTVIAQQAWNQGVDLYGFANNRILAISEFTAKANLIQPGTNGSYYQVPWVPYIYNVWPTIYWDTSISTNSIGSNRPTWVCIYHHFVNVKGIAAPYTGQQMIQQGAEGTQGNWGCCSGSFDQVGYETLTCSLDPIAYRSPPSGLSWSLVAGNVSISWWGTVNATSYNIVRAPQGGTYVPAANGITDPLTYNEQAPSPGIYYYVAVARPDNIWSQPLQVNANPQALIVYYTFDGSSGNTVADSSGNGNDGVLNGNGAWVAGKINNGLKLDGSTGYVSLPGTILQSLSDFTIASWLYMTGWQNNQRLFDFGYGAERCMWFSPTTCNINSCNGSSTFQITYNGGGDKTQLVNTPANLNTNQWLHIAVVRYGNLTQLYVNGNVVNSNSYIYLQPFQLGQGTNNIAQYWIGRSQNSGDSHLAGIVDDFRLYQGALTAAQISALASMSGK